MLSDTLYRVPRESGLHVLQRRGRGAARELTSWRLRLGAGERATYRSADEESVLVLQEGEGHLQADGGRWAVGRRGVFTERATALYLPPGVEVTVTASSPLEAILVSTPAEPGGQVAFIGPDAVQVQPRGRNSYLREVHDVFVNDRAVKRLMVGETFNPGGNWSSYPPHKHDGSDGEPRLEEVYHFRIDPPQGFGYQTLYTAAGESVTHRVQDGDTVLLPYGYHPVAAAPGYRLYYLWALAGEGRRLVVHEDPQHRWVHDV
jgi:5-deoxy-glucuronate isomerase